MFGICCPERYFCREAVSDKAERSGSTLRYTLMIGRADSIAKTLIMHINCGPCTSDDIGVPYSRQ